MSFGSPTVAGRTPSPSCLNTAKSIALDGLFYWIIYSRGASAVISASATLFMLMTFNSFLGYKNNEHTDLGNNIVFSMFAIITLLNFIGMGISSAFAQAYRANRTLEDLKNNKFTFARVPALTFGSTFAYGAQLGINTLGSFPHLLAVLAQNFQVKVPGPISNLMLILGTICGLGYMLATINFNNTAISEREREKSRGIAPSMSPSQHFWFAVANNFPQLALNCFIFYSVLKSLLGNSVSPNVMLWVSLVTTLATALTIWPTQMSSFARNTQLKDNGIFNIIKQAGNRNIYLPDSLSLSHTILFKVLVSLSNLSAFLIAVQSSNAFATMIPSLFINLDSNNPKHKIIYFVIFAATFFFCLINAGNYMAFNTVTALNAFFYYIRTATLPNAKQMTYLEALQKLQAKYGNDDSARKKSIDKAWKEIGRDKDELAKIDVFIRTIENKLGLFHEKTALANALGRLIPEPVVAIDTFSDLITTNSITLDEVTMKTLVTLKQKIDESISNLKIDELTLPTKYLNACLTEISLLCKSSTSMNQHLINLKDSLEQFIKELCKTRSLVATKPFYEILMEAYEKNGDSLTPAQTMPTYEPPTFIQPNGINTFASNTTTHFSLASLPAIKDDSSQLWRQ